MKVYHKIIICLHFLFIDSKNEIKFLLHFEHCQLGLSVEIPFMMYSNAGQGFQYFPLFSCL